MTIAAPGPVQDAARAAPAADRQRPATSGDGFARMLDRDRGSRDETARSGGGPTGETDAGAAQTAASEPERDAVAAGREEGEFSDDTSGEATEEREEAGQTAAPVTGSVADDEWDAAVTMALAEVGRASGAGTDAAAGPEAKRATAATGGRGAEAAAGQAAHPAPADGRAAPSPAGTARLDGAASAPAGPETPIPQVARGLEGSAAIRGSGGAAYGPPAQTVQIAAPGQTVAAAAASAGKPPPGEAEAEPARRQPWQEAGRGELAETRQGRTERTERSVPLPALADAAARQQTKLAAGSVVTQGGGDLAVPSEMPRAEAEAVGATPSAAQAPNAAPADALARSAAPATHGASAATVRQVLDAVVTAEGDRIEVALSPEELGRVRITISQSDGGLSLNLSAERQETMALLRRHAEELARSLADMGLGSADIAFSDGRSPDQDGGRAVDRGAGPILDGPAGPATDTSPQPRRAAGDGRMDLRL